MRDRIKNASDPVGKYYKLTADIDLTSETYWEGIGNSNSFNGYFDGQGHNVSLDVVGSGVFDSLFDTVEGDAVICNLNVTGSIKSGCSGTIVHYLNSGTVENCSFNGTVIVTGSYYGAGGLIAHQSGGTVINCRVNAVISADNYAGGIVWELESGDIKDCTIEDGTIITGRHSGGIAGRINPDYSGNISGSTYPSGYSLSGEGEAPDNNKDDDNEEETPESSAEKWNGHRYQIIEESVTWDQAKKQCESRGGHLATITSQTEQEFISSLLKDSRGNYWLGAEADDSGWWHWVTDEVFERQYQNFADNQPDGSGIYLQADGYGKWDDVSEGTAGFICEWDDEPEEITADSLADVFLQWQANPEAWQDTDGTLYSGALPSPENTSHLRNNPPATDALSSVEGLPVSYDSRTAAGLPEVRNQGNFGTCWAFAAIGAMEADSMAQGISSSGTVPDLSELHLAWFTYKNPSSDYEVRNATGCVLDEGGTSLRAISFLSKGAASIVSESDMPYSVAGNDNNTANRKIEAFLNGRLAGDFDEAGITLSDTITIDYIGQETSIETVKKYIMEHGAVYINYLHDNEGYSETHHSFYSIRDVKNLHAVLLIGWDDNYPASNFIHNPSKNGAWLVRNSWSSLWGDNGYFWMSYEQADTDYGMGDGRVFIVKETSRDVKVQEHDENGKTQNISSVWSANIFRADRNEDLTHIGFYTTDNNANYEIYVNNLGKETPSDPGGIGTALLRGEMPYMGYHTVYLPIPVRLYEGDYYSIIVKMELPSGYEYPTGAEGSINRYAVASVRRGESFFAEGERVPSVWQDGADVENGPYNACIKGFTSSRVSYEDRPMIMNTSLPDATAGEAYTFKLTAEGYGAVEWRAGRLPSGFSVSRQGVLSGKTNSSGKYYIRFMAFNEVGASVKTLMLTVNEASDANDRGVIPAPGNKAEPNDDPESYGEHESYGEYRDYGEGPDSSGGGCTSGFAVWACVMVLGVVLRQK